MTDDASKLDLLSQYLQSEDERDFTRAGYMVREIIGHNPAPETAQKVLQMVGDIYVSHVGGDLKNATMVKSLSYIGRHMPDKVGDILDMVKEKFQSGIVFSRAEDVLTYDVAMLLDRLSINRPDLSEKFLSTIDAVKQRSASEHYRYGSGYILRACDMIAEHIKNPTLDEKMPVVDEKDTLGRIEAMREVLLKRVIKGTEGICTEGTVKCVEAPQPDKLQDDKDNKGSVNEVVNELVKRKKLNEL